MRNTLLTLLLFITFINIVFAYPKIPNKEISPGNLCSLTNKDFKELRYQEKIPYCSRNVSTSLKDKIYNTYKIPKEERKNYTIDHIIPLSLGGSNDFKNLWPEHYEVKNTRQNLEYNLYIKIREGKINQDCAIKVIFYEKFKELN
jgi:hypothetical protein